MKKKRVVCFVLIFTFLLMCVMPAFAADLSENDYLAMEANDITVNSGNVVINGYVDERKSDLTQGIISTLDYADGEYAEGSVSYNGEEAVFSGSLMATGSIYVSAERMNSETFAVLYSEKDIVINCSTMELYGMIYAPNGTVYMNAETVKLVGSVIADKIVINASKVEICPDEYSYRMYQYFWTYRNDGYMEWDCYPENDTIVLDCNSNKELKSVTVYVRYNDNKEFEVLGSTEGENGSVSGLKEFRQLDIIAEGISKYGETVTADVLSFGYEDEELVRENRDTDGDGIEDGIEIFYLRSDPKNADTDGDGFDDGMEVFWLNTDPLTWDEDADFDEDGLSNKEEIRKGTNAYLPDSDFDGITDRDDAEPLVYSNSGKEVEYITHIELGVLDRVIVGYDENGERVQFIYDFVHNLRKMEIAQDYVTAYYYDYNNALSAKVMHYEEEFFASSYTYKDSQVATFAKNGYLYEFSYDDKHNMLEATVNGNPLVSFLRDDGLAVQKSFGNGDIVVYDYESDDCTKIFINGTLALESEADSDAGRECMKYYLSGQKVVYEYDSEGQLSGLAIGEDFRIEYKYEASDEAEQKKVTYTVCGETFSQTDCFSESSVSSVLPSGASVTYDSTETYVTETLKNQASSRVTQYFYNKYDEVEKMLCGDTEYTYCYDENGNLTTIKENGVLRKEYQYDILRRLTEEKDYEQGLCRIYSYNLSGNLLKKVTCTLEGTVLDESSYSYSEVFQDRLLSYNGRSFSYDAVGNPLIYKEDYRFGWTGDKLTEASYNGKQMEFFYNSDGFLTKKVVDGVVTEYYLEGSDYIAEVTDEESMIFMYDAYASLTGFLWNGEEYYYVKNVRNDIVAILDDSCNVLCEYEYDAWGNVIGITGDKELAEANPYRYRGYYYDNDLNLYYLRSRYYDSETGRFVSPDSIDMILQEGNNNLYVYCSDNPVNYEDQLGLVARKIFVFALTEWEEEGANIAEKLETYFLKAKDTVAIKRITSDANLDFTSAWKSLIGYDVVVIDVHGSPTTTTVIDVNGIERLEYRTVKLLILLSCNGGHWNWRNENVAWAFSKRISGYVIAADGTVSASMNQHADYFNVIFDDKDGGAIHWAVEQGDRRTYTMGWMVYKTAHQSDTTIVTRTINIGPGYPYQKYHLCNTLTIDLALNLMKEAGYFK